MVDSLEMREGSPGTAGDKKSSDAGYPVDLFALQLRGLVVSMLLTGRIMHGGLALPGLMILVLLCALVSPLPAFAGREKQASFVIDGNTGAVLHDQAADEPRYPASLTKMMTLYMAFEEITAGRMSEDTMLTISPSAASMAPSKLGLDVGERISLGNAMKAVVTKSANDMACAIAEAIAGSEEAFARRMTQRARQIGMASTTFRNASGLPDPRQLTTARDMVTLGLRLRDDFPQQFALFQTRTFGYGGKTYKNHNTLMNGFGGMDGIKTGYTRASGFNLVSSVQRDGKYVVGAVFGGVSASVRNAHMRVLLFRALSTASTEKTRKSRPQLIARAKAVNPQAVAQAATKTAPKPVAARPPEKIAERKAEAVVATAQPPAAPDSTIRIAKVKAVMVTGQPAERLVGNQPAERLVANQPAKRPAPAAAAPRQPPPFVTASAAPRLGLGGVTKPAAVPSAKPDQARQPGTFNSQVAALGSGQRAAPARDPRVGATAPREASKAGGYLIQVGAFASEGEASKHLDMVRGRAADLLRDRKPRAEEATVGSRRIYRARFAEFDSASANAACATLRQQKVDCMVLRAP